MRRIIGSLTFGLAAITSTASRAEAQVNFNGTAHVCFEFAPNGCNPDPAVLSGFGDTWSYPINSTSTELTFRGFNFNATTDATTGLANVTFGDAQWFSNGFSGTFYMALLFNNAPALATPLVFSGTVSTLNDLLFVDFTPNQLTGSYGPSSSAFFGQLDDFGVSLAVSTPTAITGQLGVPVTAAPVPEPSTPLLLGAGLTFLGVISRRSGRRQAA